MRRVTGALHHVLRFVTSARSLAGAGATIQCRPLRTHGVPGKRISDGAGENTGTINRGKRDNFEYMCRFL